jgi:hypothetical protein
LLFPGGLSPTLVALALALGELLLQVRDVVKR